METAGKMVKEFNIPVPWGHVAVKTWGDEKNEAVLVVHGRMDNAGAFDHLIPLLPNSLYYICIDLPSHGRSSHFPPHLPLYTLNFTLVYKLAMQHFQRKKYIILGHSYGGHIGYLFTQLYPNYIEKLIMLDTVHIFPVAVNEFKDYLVNKFDTHLLMEEKMSSGKQPKYTYEEALKKLLEGRETSPLTTAAATALLQRCLKDVGGGKYVFTLDQRMKNYLDPIHDFHYAIETIKENPVTCPVLIILGKENVFQTRYMKPILQVLRKFKNVSIQHVDGGHDVHNNNAEIVAPLVNKFLLNKKDSVGQNTVKKYTQKVLHFLKWARLMK